MKQNKNKEYNPKISPFTLQKHLYTLANSDAASADNLRITEARAVVISGIHKKKKKNKKRK